MFIPYRTISTNFFQVPDNKPQQESVLHETSNMEKSDVSHTSTVMPPLQLPHRIVETMHKEVYIHLGGTPLITIHWPSCKVHFFGMRQILHIHVTC